jgi:predicted transcriptional regulator
MDTELCDKLAIVAARLDRSEAWVVEQAIKEVLDLQLWQIAAIEQGLRDADAGHVAAHEDVVAWVDSWDRPDELPMPECE